MAKLMSNCNTTKLSFLKAYQRLLENHKTWIQRKQSSDGKCNKTISPPTPAAPAKLQQRDLDLLILSSLNESFTSYFCLQRPLRASTASSYKNKRQVWGNLVAGSSLLEAGGAGTLLHGNAGSVFPVPPVWACGKLDLQQQVLLEMPWDTKIWGWLLNGSACWVAASFPSSPELLVASQ